MADSSVGLDSLVGGWFPKYFLFMAVSMKYFFQIITWSTNIINNGTLKNYQRLSDGVKYYGTWVKPL